MSIVTKQGDKGITSLWGGMRVPKDHMRIESCGALDELCSFLGLAKAHMHERATRRAIDSIQKDLFILGAEIATDAGRAAQLKRRLSQGEIARLEGVIQQLEARRVQPRMRFVIPGGTCTSSIFDVARAIARRLERRVVTLAKKHMIVNDCIGTYLNRLSDCLFLMARSGEQQDDSRIQRGTTMAKNQKYVCIPCGRQVTVDACGVSEESLWCCGMPMQRKPQAARKKKASQKR